EELQIAKCKFQTANCRTGPNDPCKFAFCILHFAFRNYCSIVIVSFLMKTSDPSRRRALQIVRLLAKQYPDAHCALHHENPLQLLIATILSAQCTDVRVNMVTPALFARYRDAKAYASAKPGELEEAIQSTGFF